MGFRFVGTDGTDEVTVGGGAIGRDEVFADGKKCTGTLDAFIGRTGLSHTTRKQSAKLIGVTLHPDMGVGAFEKLMDGWEFGFRSRRGNIMCQSGNMGLVWV